MTVTSMTTKERGMLCRGDMARAILDDRKTETRRPIKRLAGIGKVTEFGQSSTPGYDFAFRDRQHRWNELTKAETIAKCPYGVAGDRIWVREAFSTDVRDPLNCVIYKATPEYGKYRDTGEIVRSSFPDGSLPTREEAARGMLPKFWKGKPAIHMPRWASRILLELTEVKIEPVQLIRELDAKAEGVANKARFVEIWMELYGREPISDMLLNPFSWYVNPLVWVLKFKRIG